MPTQPALVRPQRLRSARNQRFVSPVKCPTVGQCFDIEVTRETDGWLIRIPEIGGVAHAGRRATVELVAREYIAVRTGIPIGYVTIFVARDTR
jgi:hypothetical protein